MRVWSIHPQYLDSRGLVALWRETLLAQAVLRGETKGYRNHPQLDRFKNHSDPQGLIALYLQSVCDEATNRGYKFDRSKIHPVEGIYTLPVTQGQIEYEWQHLMEKLRVRQPDVHQKWLNVTSPALHPLFTACPGEIEAWEKLG
jgi:hypothetical protein